MLAMETSIEPKDVKPILADALRIFQSKAVELLRRLTKRSKNLPPGWEHIEDAFKVLEGKSETFASAFAKVFRRASPQAIWIEFGHRIVVPKKKMGSGGAAVTYTKFDTGRRVVAFPFFRTALDTTRRQMLQFIRKGVQRLLASEARRQGFEHNTPDDTGWIG